MIAKKTYDRECRQCGEQFVTNNHRRTICSDDCRLILRKNSSQNASKKYRETLKGKLAKKTYKYECKQCGKDFVTSNHRKTICSDDCRKTIRNEYFKKRWKRIKESKGKIKYFRICLSCGNQFKTEVYQAKMCSKVCSISSIKNTKRNWQESDKGKDYLEKYKKTESYSKAKKKWSKRYNDSERGKRTRLAYLSSENVKLRIKDWVKKNRPPQPGWEVRKEQPHLVYLIKFTQGNKVYLKVGITRHSAKQRFSDDLAAGRMSNLEVIEEVKFENFETCKVAETIIHDATLDSQVNPVIYFHGSVTECRLPSALPQLLSMFESAKAGKLEVANG